MILATVVAFRPIYNLNMTTLATERHRWSHTIPFHSISVRQPWRCWKTTRWFFHFLLWKSRKCSKCATFTEFIGFHFILFLVFAYLLHILSLTWQNYNLSNFHRTNHLQSTNTFLPQSIQFLGHIYWTEQTHIHTSQLIYFPISIQRIFFVFFSRYHLLRYLFQTKF